MLVEPQARGTTVAIAYGAAIIERRLGEATIAVTPADHLIVRPLPRFDRTLGQAFELARAPRRARRDSRRRRRPAPSPVTGT